VVAVEFAQREQAQIQDSHRGHMPNNEGKAFVKNESLQQYNAFRIKVATACREGDAKTNGAPNALSKAARPADTDAEFKKQNLALFDVIVELTYIKTS
jgi:hypothetical protein